MSDVVDAQIADDDVRLVGEGLFELGLLVELVLGSVHAGTGVAESADLEDPFFEEGGKLGGVGILGGIFGADTGGDGVADAGHADGAAGGSDPVISAEGGRDEPVGVGEIPISVHVPSVANRLWLVDAWGGNMDGVPGDGGGGGDEITVGSGDLEFAEGLAIGGGEFTTDVVEFEGEGVSFRSVGEEDGAGGGDILVVDLVEGDGSESFGDGFENLPAVIIHQNLAIFSRMAGGLWTILGAGPCLAVTTEKAGAKANEQ